MKKRVTMSDNEVADEGEELDVALEQLKREEQNESRFQEQRVSSELEKAKSVRIQKKVFDQFLHQRILMQKLITGANRLPSEPKVLQQFCKKSTKIDSGLKRCRRELKAYLKDVTKV